MALDAAVVVGSRNGVYCFLYCSSIFLKYCFSSAFNLGVSSVKPFFFENVKRILLGGLVSNYDILFCTFLIPFRNANWFAPFLDNASISISSLFISFWALFNILRVKVSAVLFNSFLNFLSLKIVSACLFLNALCIWLWH